MPDLGSTEDAGKQSLHYWPEILGHKQQRYSSIVVVIKKIYVPFLRFLLHIFHKHLK